MSADDCPTGCLHDRTHSICLTHGETRYGGECGCESIAGPIDRNFLYDQQTWSENTFGHGTRTHSVLDHIRKELIEIEDAPYDLSEWADLILLALDGARRAGYTPNQILHAVRKKHEINKTRTWPDWRTAEPGKAIEHNRDVTLSAGVVAALTSCTPPSPVDLLEGK